MSYFIYVLYEVGKTMMDDNDTQKPLTFRDNAKKDEIKVRDQEKESLDKLSDMKGIIKPMPDSIKLAHPKPPFTEAMDILFKAALQLLKPLKPAHKDSTKPKNKQR